MDRQPRLRTGPGAIKHQPIAGRRFDNELTALQPT
jgi:hypothetical protein